MLKSETTEVNVIHLWTSLYLQVTVACLKAVVFAGYCPRKFFLGPWLLLLHHAELSVSSVLSQTFLMFGKNVYTQLFSKFTRIPHVLSIAFSQLAAFMDRVQNR